MSNARELAELAGSYGTGGFVGMKNRIINGDMRIDQRNAGGVVAASQNVSNVYMLDRWCYYFYGVGTANFQQVSDAPAGFTKSLKMTVTGVDSTIAGADDYMIRHFIEGFNFADMGWGAAGAQSATLSFWVKCSTTGVIAVALQSGAGDLSYVTPVTINSANTWEYKTVTIAGPASGTFATGNTANVSVNFSVGNSKTNTANTWNAGNYIGVSGATNFMATNGLTFQVTGVQLEKGSTATSFDYRPYGTELALCQRYYFKTGSGAGGTLAIGQAANSTLAEMHVHFPVSMRAAPTALDQSGTASNYSIIYGVNSAASTVVPYIAGSQSTKDIGVCVATVSSVLTAGYAVYLRSSAGGALGFSSEL